MLFLFALLIPTAAAFIPIRFCWPPTSRSPSLLVLQLCLVAGAGLGIASCGHFLWFPAFGPPGLDYVAAELAVATTAAIGACLLRKRRVSSNIAAEQTSWRWLWVPFTLAAIVAVAYLVIVYIQKPHGNWDAVAIWSVRARFLVRAGDHWQDTFSPILFHADYPLLLPGTVARCWLYDGSETTLAPFFVGALYAALTAGVLVAGLNLTRGAGQGWLAGFALVCAHPYLHCVGLQHADAPLGFYYLAVAALFALHDRTGRDGLFYPCLAGLMTGLAAWTKNEGQLFLAVMLAARVVLAYSGGPKRFAREATAFGVGLLPPLLTLAFFKLRFAPPNDLAAGFDPSVAWVKLADPGRYELIARWTGEAVWDFGPGLVALLVVYAVLIGLPPKAARRPGVWCPWLLLAGVSVGYGLVYLTTPHDLDWHLRTSVLRLVAQVWPLFLFALFLTIATPAEALATNNTPESDRPHPPQPSP